MKTAIIFLVLSFLAITHLSHFVAAKKCIEGTDTVCTPFTYKGTTYTDECYKGWWGLYCSANDDGSINDKCGECVEPTTTPASTTTTTTTKAPTTTTTTTTTTEPTTTTTTTKKTTTKAPTTTTTTTEPTTTTTTTTKPTTTTTTTTRKTTTTKAVTKPPTTTTTTKSPTTTKTRTTAIEDESVEEGSADGDDQESGDVTTPMIVVYDVTEVTEGPATTPTEKDTTTENAEPPKTTTITSQAPEKATPKSTESDKSSESDVKSAGSDKPAGSDKKSTGNNEETEAARASSNILTITIVGCIAFLVAGIAVTGYIFKRRFRSRNDQYETKENTTEKESALPLAEYRTKTPPSDEQERISSVDKSEPTDPMV